MAGSKMDAATYAAYVQFSTNKHLLVEGPHDKILFTLLQDELYRRSGRPRRAFRIDIDTAEDLICPGTALGNREKVESVCDLVVGSSYADKLVGFVDREFRGFERGDVLRDSLESHRVLGRLVWSRGHSIENYVFDFELLREVARDLSPTPYFVNALDLFSDVFEGAVRLACAISLAADAANLIKRARASIRWEMIRLLPSAVEPNFEEWNSILNSLGFTSSDAESFLDNVSGWLRKVETADFRVVRWMCHGHIGFCMIWAVYVGCLVETCRQHGLPKPEAEAAKFLRTREGDRFHTSASWWVRRALGNQCVYPIEVLKLIGWDAIPETE